MQSDPSTDWSETLANNNAPFHNVQKNSSTRNIETIHVLEYLNT